MRNPKRIKIILKKIEKLWEDSPDQRFYQLLINYGLIPDGHLWHTSDDEVEKAFDWIFKNKAKKPIERRKNDK